MHIQSEHFSPEDASAKRRANDFETGSFAHSHPPTNGTMPTIQG
jgi:hypothetical protein